MDEIQAKQKQRFRLGSFPNTGGMGVSPHTQWPRRMGMIPFSDDNSELCANVMLAI
mgnify:CR=1 FL=1